LMGVIQQYTEGFGFMGLSEFGVHKKMIKKIVSRTDNKNNPVTLSSEEMNNALIKAM